MKAVVSCNLGNFLASGRETGFLMCQDGNWILEGDSTQPVKTIECREGCAGGCLNGGFCLVPGQCSCLPGYEGNQCQLRTCPMPTENEINANILKR